MVARLQIKASQIGKILQTLENKSNEAAAQAEAAGGSGGGGKKMQSGSLKNSKTDSGAPPVKKPHYIDPIPPFNANKIRKSPSGNPTEPLKDDSPQTPLSALPLPAPQLNDKNN